MTDKPTPEQIQRACDLANASNPAFVYTAIDYDDLRNHSFRALADTIAQLDAMQAERDRNQASRQYHKAKRQEAEAERDKARADLAEIDRIAEEGVWGHPSAARNAQRVAAIAAPYRVETDPLLLEAREIAAASDNMVAANVRAGEWDNSHIVQCCLAALKRGLEIGRAA